MSPGKGQIFVLLLVTILHVVILQAAPADPPPPSGGAKPAAAAVPSGDSSPNATTPAPDSEPIGPKPTNLINPATNTKPQRPSSNHMFASCWSCLFDAVEELCSYLTDWTTPKRMPSLNLFSLFQEGSSEESDEDTSSSGMMPSLASLFRFRRSVEDSPESKEAFLDLLDGFYVKSRQRFALENPGVIPTSLENMYSRSDEIAQVVAYVLGVPKELLIHVFQNMKTKDTGIILLRALNERRSASIGKQELSEKTVGGLTPTSISYFFQELLGSFNGVMTGFSELIHIALQNQQNTNAKPNQA